MPAHPPEPGRVRLHYPDDEHRTSPPQVVDVEDRGDGVLVWLDPYTGSMFGTGPAMPAISSAHRWERIR